jgi:hypothetical protein
MTQPNLRIIEKQPVDLYIDHRRHIMSRDWSKVHTDADRRSPFATVMGKGR